MNLTQTLCWAHLQVADGPDDEGENFDRPGRLADTLPAPYANENAARAANGGAYPPDLSLITKAVQVDSCALNVCVTLHGWQNYIVSVIPMQI